MNILWAIIALSFLILIHELGHFVVARWADIKVLEFSIFMGPKLFPGGKVKLNTLYVQFLWEALFCMEGEEEDSDDERAFNKKPAWKRALVVVPQVRQ